MRFSIISLTISFLLCLAFVSSKAIYDIHDAERIEPSKLLTAQRSRGVTNGMMMAMGLKQLQPPKGLASQIGGGKKRRANLVGKGFIGSVDVLDLTVNGINRYRSSD